jgi:hypothetical protein
MREGAPRQRRAEMNQHKERMREMIYDANYDKPKYLVHYVGGLNKPDYDAYEEVIENGMQVDRGRWKIDRLNRPSGIFFFGEEMDHPLSHKVTVRVSDLDTGKLFAFPAMLADAVIRLVVDGTFANQPEEWKEALMELAEEIEAVPYDEYDGSFGAEWIYTDDIGAELIS